MTDFLPTDMALPSWYTARIAPNGDVDDNEGGCHPDEAAALQKYLSPYISPSTDSLTQQAARPSNPPRQPPTPSQAARAITHFITTQPDPKDHLHHLWGLLEDALADAPENALDALIALMAAIEELPDPAALSLSPATKTDNANADGGDTKAPPFWKGSPQFANLWSDMYPSYAWRGYVDSSAGSRREELKGTHVRRAEVEARLVRAGLAGVTLDWGYQVVADALESSTAVLEFEVPAAARWVGRCAGLFKRGAEAGDGSWGLRGERDLWTGEGPDGEKMSLKRWAFWGERLRALQGDDGLVREVRNALEAMGEV